MYFGVLLFIALQVIFCRRSIPNNLNVKELRLKR